MSSQKWVSLTWLYLVSSKSIFEVCQLVLLLIFKWSQKIKLCFTTLTHEENLLVLYFFSASVIFPSREREKPSGNVSRYLVKGGRKTSDDGGWTSQFYNIWRTDMAKNWLKTIVAHICQNTSMPVLVYNSLQLSQSPFLFIVEYSQNETHTSCRDWSKTLRT